MANKPGPEYEPDSGESKSVRETDPLLIPEILIRILEFASPGGNAAAACVCRRWSDPALEVLWQDLADLGPFLKIFALLKNIESRMSPAETLERIKSYGARVRTLRFKAPKSSIHESGTAEVYQALCAGKLDQYLPTVSVPSSGLFPNLRTLEWRSEEPRMDGEDTLEAVSYFLCPSLKHLHVSGIAGQLGQRDHGFIWGPSVNCAPFFRTLNAMDGFKLESLELRMRDFAEELTQDHEVGLFLRRHQDTLLHFYAWTTEFVRHFQNELCGLSRLRSLEVSVDNELQASAFVEGLAAGAPEMESLHLTVYPYEESHPWQGLWSALKRLGKLTKLHPEVPEIKEMEEGDVMSMREAWPDLSYLYILQKYGGWRDRDR
ncbi:hypothetical protein M407DRAFT_19730 [Tulasnella calospora MUT 4182]|uniref:F-box domain-containing protein n=1 Tax=Tulasnella calospora MUT 4182 TaxID=1051891 RepID=A0A0C3LBU2_9AGAM|nr:hypothetical protein M407DRAFT_19730 [Tulasnella calospora MUT 4182]